MKNFTVLPADTYTVINKSIITDKDNKIITMLYQPIIGFTAVSLYNTLVADLEKSELMSEDLTHYHLMATMQLKLEDIIIAREKLEAVGLIKTYLKQGSVNQFVYLIYSPISVSDFFNHPILNIVLYNNLGKTEYDKVKNYFRVPKINLKDYEDITSSFDQVFSPVRGTVENEEDDITKVDSNNIQINKGIDFNLILSSIPKTQINDKCFSDEVRELINNLSYIYNLDSLDMQGLVRNSLNEKGLIDKTLLRKNCRDYYQFDNYGNLPTLIYNRQPEYLKKPRGENSKWAQMVYIFENTTPYQFLKAKSKGAEPTERDLKLVESLLVDQKLTPGVVNVLLSYVLRVNNEKLSKAYVETIAGQWKRLNIETVEDAMRYSEKEHKKLNKIVKDKATNAKPISKQVKEEALPAWFNKEQEVLETTKEEAEEMDKILSELV